MLNASRTVGAAIGLAVLAAVAAGHTAALLSGDAATPAQTAGALTEGYGRAMGVGAVALLAGGILATFIIPPRRASPGIDWKSEQNRIPKNGI